MEETGRQLRLADDNAYRAAFEPHAVILTERLIPQPIFVAAFIGPARLLRIDFDVALPPATFVTQALDGLHQKLLEFNPGLRKPSAPQTLSDIGATFLLLAVPLASS